MNDTVARPWKERIRRYGTRMLIGVGAITLIISFTMTLLLMISGLRTERVPRQVILELNLERGVIESAPEDPLGAFLRRDDLTIRDIIDALERARTDDRVRGLIARVGSGSLGLAQVEEVRAAVTRFREAGKRAVVFAETFGEFAPGRNDYYLAAAFDEIYLQPSGDVGLAGLISEQPFLAGTFDLVGIQPQMDHRHEFKDALNLLTEEAMTEPQREATLRVLTSIYDNLVEGIARGRDLTPDSVRQIIDSGPYFGAEAVEVGLVDRLSYRDEVYDSLRSELGGEFLFAQHYLSRAGRPHDRGPMIALIYGTGTVQRGESQIDPMVGGAVMGSETVGRAFREAVESEDVRAIVFRVDSPGGSYVASDAIWRETLRAREAGKPVIVSMGNVAGSGGYFVAAGADRIVAQPSTITGSIGVFGGKILIEELSSKLGVTWDDVRVGGNATMWSTVREFSAEEWVRLQTALDRIYDDFTAKVAQGRGLTRDSTHAIARGRIWSGADAQQLGLVDALGGMDLALSLSKELAGIDEDAPVHVRVFPRERSIVEMLLDRGPSSSEPTALETVAAVGTWVQPLISRAREAGIFLEPPGVLTMPFVPVVR